MSGKGARSWRTGSSGWGSRHDAVRRSRPLARSDGIGYHKIASKSESEMSKKPTFIACEIIPRSTCRADELKALAGALERWHDALSGWEWNSGIHFYLHDLDLRDLR